MLVSLPQNESKGVYHLCICLNVAPSQSQNAALFFFFYSNQPEMPVSSNNCLFPG